jgi:hypothetical protein
VQDATGNRTLAFTGAVFDGRIDYNSNANNNLILISDGVTIRAYNAGVNPYNTSDLTVFTIAASSTKVLVATDTGYWVLTGGINSAIRLPATAATGKIFVFKNYNNNNYIGVQDSGSSEFDRVAPNGVKRYAYTGSTWVSVETGGSNQAAFQNSFVSIG